MSDLGETSWKAGAALLAFVVAILLLGWRFGGGDPTPTKVQLTCTTYGDGSYDCEARP